MKHTALSIAAVCSTLLVGCNQLNRVGSQSIVFDRDPFVQLDENQSTAANHAPASGRVNVGNLNSAPQANYQAQAQQQPAATATYSFNGGGNSDVAATYAPQQQPVAPPQYTNTTVPKQFQPMPQPAPAVQSQLNSSPASRAAAEAAALLANMGQQPQHIQQMSHEATAARTPAAAQPSGVVTADFSPDPFEPETSQYNRPDMMTPTGVVPMPPEALYNPTSDKYELSEADLEIPTLQPNSEPQFHPGTNIPIGKVSLDAILPADWEPAPKPASTVSTVPVQTNPVFSPPTGSEAIPVTPTQAREAGPIIRDSTNHSKWRAARRQ